MKRRNLITLALVSLVSLTGCDAEQTYEHGIEILGNIKSELSENIAQVDHLTYRETNILKSSDGEKLNKEVITRISIPNLYYSIESFIDNEYSYGEYFWMDSGIAYTFNSGDANKEILDNYTENEFESECRNEIDKLTERGTQVAVDAIKSGLSYDKNSVLKTMESLIGAGAKTNINYFDKSCTSSDFTSLNFEVKGQYAASHSLYNEMNIYGVLKENYKYVISDCLPIILLSKLELNEKVTTEDNISTKYNLNEQTGKYNYGDVEIIIPSEVI